MPLQIPSSISNPEGSERVTFWFICCSEPNSSNCKEIAMNYPHEITAGDRLTVMHINWDLKLRNETRRSLCREKKKQLWPLVNIYIKHLNIWGFFVFIFVFPICLIIGSTSEWWHVDFDTPTAPPPESPPHVASSLLGNGSQLKNKLWHNLIFCNINSCQWSYLFSSRRVQLFIQNKFLRSLFPNCILRQQLSLQF